MTICDRTQQRLNALTDCELSPWVSAGVRRHLKSCESCRADYLLIQNISSQFREWRETSVPEHLSPRIANAVAHSAVTTEPAPMTHRWRWQPFAALAAAAVVLAFAVALLSSNALRPTVAFAEVRQAMETVRNVSWQQTETRYDLSGQRTLRRTQELWVRRDPPAIAERDAPSEIAQTPGGEYADASEKLSDSHGEINYHIGQGIYYLHPASDIAQRVRQTIADLTASAGNRTPWKMNRATLSGHPVLIYQSRVHELADISQSGSRTMDGEIAIWADPATHQVIRRRSDITFGPTRVRPDSGRGPWTALPAERIVQDASEFQYGQPAPQGVFALRPPPDAKVTEDDGKGNKTLITPNSGATTAP